MKEVKSPDLGKAKKRPVKLPPQQSATDTSNWEGRNVSAPTLDKITSKRVVREIEFIRNDDQSEARPMTLAQIQRLEAKERVKKTSK